MSKQRLIFALLDRRARAEAELVAYRAKVKLARAELDALEATVDLFATDDPEAAQAFDPSREAHNVDLGAPI